MVQEQFPAYILTKHNLKIKTPQVYPNHLKVHEVIKERKVKVNLNHYINLHHLPLPLNKMNSMKMQTITTTMRIMEVTLEAADPTGANIAVESHIEGLSKGEGDNKIITEANTKATMDNLTLPW